MASTNVSPKSFRYNWNEETPLPLNYNINSLFNRNDVFKSFDMSSWNNALPCSPQPNLNNTHIHSSYRSEPKLNFEQQFTSTPSAKNVSNLNSRIPFIYGRIDNNSNITKYDPQTWKLSANRDTKLIMHKDLSFPLYVATRPQKPQIDYINLDVLGNNVSTNIIIDENITDSDMKTSVDSREGESSSNISEVNKNIKSLNEKFEAMVQKIDDLSAVLSIERYKNGNDVHIGNIPMFKTPNQGGLSTRSDSVQYISEAADTSSPRFGKNTRSTPPFTNSNKAKSPAIHTPKQPSSRVPSRKNTPREPESPEPHQQHSSRVSSRNNTPRDKLQHIGSNRSPRLPENQQQTSSRASSKRNTPRLPEPQQYSSRDEEIVEDNAVDGNYIEDGDYLDHEAIDVDIEPEEKRRDNKNTPPSDVTFRDSPQYIDDAADAFSDESIGSPIRVDDDHVPVSATEDYALPIGNDSPFEDVNLDTEPLSNRSRGASSTNRSAYDSVRLDFEPSSNRSNQSSSRQAISDRSSRPRGRPPGKSRAIQNSEPVTPTNRVSNHSEIRTPSSRKSKSSKRKISHWTEAYGSLTKVPGAHDLKKRAEHQSSIDWPSESETERRNGRYPKRTKMPTLQHWNGEPTEAIDATVENAIQYSLDYNPSPKKQIRRSSALGSSRGRAIVHKSSSNQGRRRGRSRKNSLEAVSAAAAPIQIHPDIKKNLKPGFVHLATDSGKNIFYKAVYGNTESGSEKIENALVYPVVITSVCRTSLVVFPAGGHVDFGIADQIFLFGYISSGNNVELRTSHEGREIALHVKTGDTFSIPQNIPCLIYNSSTTEEAKIILIFINI